MPICFAVAEANIGVAHEVCPGAEVVFGVIMGTGVGGGLVVLCGKVINGPATASVANG